jgi:hypothetical protein
MTLFFCQAYSLAERRLPAGPDRGGPAIAAIQAGGADVHRDPSQAALFFVWTVCLCVLNWKVFQMLDS